MVNPSRLRELALDADHLDHREQRFVALVRVLCAGALQRLLYVVGGENAEADGNFVIAHRGADAAGHRIADVIEMRRVAANHRAQTDKAVIFSTAGQTVGDQRNFESAWNPHHRDVLVIAAVAFQAVHGAIEEFLRDEMIVAAHDDADLQTPRIFLAFDDFAHGPAARRFSASLVWLRDSTANGRAWSALCAGSG